MNRVLRDLRGAEEQLESEKFYTLKLGDLNQQVRHEAQLSLTAAQQLTYLVECIEKALAEVVTLANEIKKARPMMIETTDQIPAHIKELVSSIESWIQHIR